MTDFTDIVECELVKRAMEVAVAGRHSLLLFGPHDYGKTLCLQAMAGLADVDNVGPLQDMTAAKRRAVIAKLDKGDRAMVAEVIPCPCGSYGDPYAICRCDTTRIVDHRDKLQDVARSFDMLIGVPRPIAVAMAKGTPYHGEDTATVKARIERAATNAVPEGLSEDAQSLLAKAISHAPLSPKQATVAKAIGATVARLDGKATVEVFHISEAIQYVTGLNNTWGSLGD